MDNFTPPGPRGTTEDKKPDKIPLVVKKGPDSRYSMINARAETVHQKPAYRGSLHYRRCLIPAEVFYEWKPGPGGKQPYAIRMKSRAPFAFAGLWDSWAALDGSELEICTIIVTDANELLRPIR